MHIFKYTFKLNKLHTHTHNLLPESMLFFSIKNKFVVDADEGSCTFITNK